MQSTAPERLAAAADTALAQHRAHCKSLAEQAAATVPTMAQVETFLARVESMARGARLLRSLTPGEIADLRAVITDLGDGRFDQDLLDKAAALR